MARYIDVDALIDRLGINQDCTECSYCTRKCYCSWNPDPGEICIAISEQPTVTINDTAEENKVTNCNYNQFAEVSKKGDMISRADAVDAISKIKRTDNWQAAVSMALMDLPSAQPERKTGKWIEFLNHNAYKCSECGRIIETADGKNNVYRHYPYCHCGARMEGEEHD